MERVRESAPQSAWKADVLPLITPAYFFWSGLRDSELATFTWQGDTLPLS